MPAIRSDYLKHLVDVARLPETVTKLVKLIKDSEVEFDAIAFRGMSGALIAPIIAMKLKKNMLMVRKDDGNHFGSNLEGVESSERYIIIDDLICSGNTLRIIREEVTKRIATAQCVGVFLSRESWSNKHKFADDFTVPLWSVK
jgi:orotate phosphoribosyltransferase